jgi:voltage-gated potassium channel
MHSVFHGQKSIAVLALLVGVLLIDPFIPGAWENLTFLFIAAAAAWLLTDRGTTGRRLVVFLISSILVISCVAVVFPKSLSIPARSPIVLIFFMATLLLLGYSVYLLLQALWKARVVRAEQIVGTINLYLVLGICWSFMYALVAWFDPHSFDLPPNPSEALSNLIYFSFVTLASVGYGDIVPKTPFAQRLAIMEAIMGQFYTAVLVAYLLSVYIGGRSQESGPHSGRGPGNDDRH